VEVFLAIECDLSGLGHIIGVYSRIENACEEIKRYFNGVVISVDGRILSYEDTYKALDNHDRCVHVECEGWTAFIFKYNLDEPHP